jgi:transposase-like protein
MAKREKQKRYSLEFREMAVRRMKLGDNVSQLSRELGVDRTCLYHWKRKHDRRPYSRVVLPEPDWRDQRIEELEAKISRLEGIIGGQWVELDFFESALRKVEEKGRKSGGNGGSASTPKSEPGCNRKAD